MKVHLDTDLGGDTDDLCALAYLLARPDVELVGVTTCTETAGRRAGFVRYALRLAGREDVPVAAGAEGLLGEHRWRDSAGPSDPDDADLWPEPVAPSPGDAGVALRLLEESVRSGATVVGVGPYTNLAMLEAVRPGLLAGARLVLMGGCVRGTREGFPAWGPETDYNVQMDAASARLLLDRCRPTLVPLDVTLETFVREADLPRLSQAGPLGSLLARQAAVHGAFWRMPELGRRYPGLPDDLLNFQHDPLACAVAVGWEGVRVESLPLEVSVRDGWLVEREEPGGRALPVVTAVDGEAFSRHWLDTVTGGRT